jgi:putative hydrolase of the HAD superfamily
MINKQSIPSISLVCFDVGGVLVRTCSLYSEGILAAGLPIRTSPEEIRRLFDLAQGIRENYRTGKIQTEEYAAEISRALDHLYTPAEILTVTLAWLYDPYPQTESILSAIHRAGKAKIAILSNTCSEHWETISKYSWRQYIAYAFASHELGIAKPALGIFQAVESATGATANEILFFDDTEANILSSSQLGWNSVLVTNGTDPGIQIREELTKWSIL